jgi:hypothetical protein
MKESLYTRGAEFWWGNLRKEDQLKDPDVDGRIILNGSSR